MFNDSQNNFSDQNQTPDGKLNFNQERDLKLEDIPIHTMKNDLENANNPNYLNSGEIAFSEKQSQPIPVSRQQTSPFLNPSSAPIQEKPVATGASSQNKPTVSTQPASPSKIGKIITTAIIIFIVLLSGFGGYYFWITKYAAEEQAVVETQPEIEQTETPTQEEQPAETTTPAIADFSTDKPNYLNLDTENPSAASVKDQVTSYAQKVAASQIATPVEFIVADKNNNPLTFSQFFSSFGINLPDSISSNLNDPFSLFIYNTTAGPRLGMSIGSKNDTSLKTGLLAEEKNFPKDIEPMFLGATYSTAPTDTFKDSSYSGSDIRFMNLTSTQELSIDYSVSKNKLIIGTTKMTLRSVIDYISANSISISTGTTAQ